MRHTDFVCIRETKSIPDINLILIFNNAVELAAGISARFLNIQQQIFEFFRIHNFLLNFNLSINNNTLLSKNLHINDILFFFMQKSNSRKIERNCGKGKIAAFHRKHNARSKKRQNNYR